jgi:hypothetical protein
MSEPKTKPTDQEVAAFLEALPDEQRRRDCRALVDLLRDVTGAEPRMWGESIVGFGERHYTYASGREGDTFVAGFSPRRQNLTVYLSYGYEQHTELLRRIGRHSGGKACLYLKRLEGVDMDALRELVVRSIAQQANTDAADGA